MQSKKHSLLESCLNVASGFIVSLALWMYLVVPLYDVKVTMYDNLNITLIFTVASIARSYVWRRILIGGPLNG